MLKMLSAIAVMTVATMFTRFFPFILFSKRPAPEWLLKGARLVPGAVMMVLVLTSLSAINFAHISQTDFKPWIGVAATAILHLIFKNPLVSIFGGTALYMVLLNFSFL
ncbi:MAG: AzlD domain-containing protein [Spirochaetales bacterium]|nr:AzlD domain-containing protein [Spirochaetales bacterium]